MASEQIGYRGPTACAAAGITYRQLDYWARTGLVEPSVRPAYGSGTQRLYSFRDVVVLKIVKRFLDTGVSLQNIRTAVQHLRERGFSDLERMTLMSDGATVYECTSPDEVHALLQGGQGVFGIAVGVVWRDVESALSQLHGERIDTGETLVGPTRRTSWRGGGTGPSEPSGSAAPPRLLRAGRFRAGLKAVSPEASGRLSGRCQWRRAASEM
ncbi:hypothetical protein SVIOM74S_05961 [Streptomyces violarus]